MNRIVLLACTALCIAHGAKGQGDAKVVTIPAGVTAGDAAKMAIEQLNQATLVVKAGEQVPAFTVELAGGGTVSADELKGKVVLVNFWATWCSPCRAEMVRFPKEVAERFAGQDFMLLAISRGEPREVVEGFREAQGYTFPIGLDPDASVYARFAESGVPRNFLIDRKCMVVETTLGYTPEGFDELVEIIDKLLKTK